MKISESLNSPGNIQGIQVKEDKRPAASAGSSFQNSLKSAEDTSYEFYIGEMAKKIAEQGEKLGKKMDIRELRLYKKLISEFIDGALGSSLKFSRQSLLDRRGRHKVYALIKKINNEIGLLTEDVISKEKNNIVILQRIDDIRGLVLDMIL